MAEDTVFANQGSGHETWLIVSHFWVLRGGGDGWDGKGVPFSMGDLDWIVDEITEYERSNFSLLHFAPLPSMGV